MAALKRRIRSLLFDLSPVSTCQCSPAWIPSDGTPSRSRMRLVGFLTGLYFPQILITLCKPEKGLTYIMLLQFGTALSSEKRQWTWLQKIRSWCWVRFGWNFQLNSSKIQIFFCGFFFLLNKSINYLCLDSHWKASYSHLKANLWICYTLSGSSKVFLDADNQSLIVL